MGAELTLEERYGIRTQVAALEAAMFASPDQLHIEPVHTFAHGLYARTVTLPAGSTATGHIHAQEHLCFITKGRVLVVSETGGTREVAAPEMFIAPRGTKNCVHAIEETTWTTVHATELRDVAKIEKAMILPTFPDEIPALEEWR